ncbi:type II toxin-antitoxin system ParD family antitoxin [Radicibacter daui]|uniref:type II toxin-antitoxin system ParD family antitoxin n=1 Tax=Radicibacter daui TaxID=3064829 RepID=UPI0040470159
MTVGRVVMVKQDEAYRLRLVRLRQELLAGERSGPAREFDFDAFLAQVEEEACQEEH